MSNDTHEIYETNGIVNVTYVRDAAGRGWYCDGTPQTPSEILGSSCVEEDSYHYDRGFGG